MIKDFFDGIGAYAEALRLFSRLGLKKYIFISGLISLVLGGLIIITAYNNSSSISDWLSEFYIWEYGSGVANWISRVLSTVLIILSGLVVYKYLIIIAVSPFMAPLAEKIEKTIVGYSVNDGGILLAWKGFVRGIRLSSRNLVRELALTIILLILSFLPGFAIFTTPLIFIVQAYYVGFGNMDYLMERHLSISEAARFTKRYKGLAIANGMIFLLLLMIPIIGLFLAPTLATTAASLETIKRLDLDK